MLKFTIIAVACSIVSVPVMAQTAPTAPAAAPVVKRSAMIVTSDGHRVGHVDSVRGANAMVIYNGQFVAVPVATLSPDGERLTTSLKLSELTGR